MAITTKTKYVILVIIFIVGALFLSGYLLGRKHGKDVLNATVNALTTEIERQTVVINNQKLYVTSIEQELKTLSEAKDEGDVTNKELRTLNIKQLNEISRLKVRIDTLMNDISHTGHIINIKPDSVGSVQQKAIVLPFTFTKKDQWLDLRGILNAEGNLSIGLKINADLDVYTGLDKTTKLPIAKVTSNNPYLGVLNVSSIKLDTQKPKKFGIGVFAGYGITLSGIIKASPIIGAGVSYNLIRL